VRLAALEAVGMGGDASSVPLLAAIAAGDDEAERKAARAGLASLAGKGVDQKLVDGLGGGDLKTRLEMIRAVGVRGTAAAAPVLMRLARDDNNDIRRESLAALRNTAQPGDVASLAALVATPARPADRAEAARALGAVLRRSDPSRVEETVKVYASAADSGARSALLPVMGPGGNPQALEVLRSALKEDNPDVKRAAILGLTEWPDGTPIPDLLQTAHTASNPAHQVLALRGAIRLIGIPTPGRAARESVKLLADAMGLARQAEEKRAVLALLPRYPVEESLALAKASLNESQVGAEAKNAVARLERTLKK
jgi:HEAT repeat protein